MALPRGVGLTGGRRVQTGSRVGRRGRVHITGKFKYNTRFTDGWSRDPQVISRFEQLRLLMQKEAERRVPTGTGRLLGTIKSSLTKEVNGILSIKLTAGGSVAPYWAFVEYGTGRRGASSRRGEVGTPTGWRYGTIAGQRAQPYLRPALLLVKRRIGQVGARRASRGAA